MVHVIVHIVCLPKMRTQIRHTGSLVARGERSAQAPMLPGLEQR